MREMTVLGARVLSPDELRLIYQAQGTERSRARLALLDAAAARKASLLERLEAQITELRAQPDGR